MKRKDNGNKTFMRITNEDIFNEIQSLSKSLSEMKGSMRVNQWIASSALAISVFLVGYIVKTAWLIS